MLKEIEKILTENPNCRERRVRWKVISLMLKEKYPTELGSVDLARIWDIVGDGISIDRMIRDSQQNNEAWRGLDYGDGEKLSQEYQVKKLGKEAGHRKRSKKLAEKVAEEIPF